MVDGCTFIFGDSYFTSEVIVFPRKVGHISEIYTSSNSFDTTLRSTLPPLKMTPMFKCALSCVRALFIIASLKSFEKKATARETAADGSMTSFILSQTNFIARLPEVFTTDIFPVGGTAYTICSSDTVWIASTCSNMRGKVISPVDVRSPSAIVCGCTEDWKVLLMKDRKASSAPSGSAPTIQTSGLRAFVVRATPDRSPPPPTGAIRTSRGRPSSWACSNNSTARVP